MKYEDMSDDQLSMEVMAVMYGEEIKHWALSESGESIYNCGFDGSSYYSIDLIDINNPSDIMPIAIDNRISLNAYDEESDGWHATTDTSFFIDDDNPYRAIAICFLKMMGSECDTKQTT